MSRATQLVLEPSYKFGEAIVCSIEAPLIILVVLVVDYQQFADLTKDQSRWLAAIRFPGDLWYTTCCPPVCDIAFAFDPQDVVEVIHALRLSLYAIVMHLIPHF